MNKMNNPINEARYFGPPTARTRNVISGFNRTEEGRDLQAIGVTIVPEEFKVRFERRNRGESMARTGVYEEDGKFYVENYSSKPGKEIYNRQEFDNIEDALRYIWIRIAKNAIPTTIISKRESEKRINVDKLFPVGSRVSQSELLDVIMPMIGGEELINPSNKEMMQNESMQKLIELSLIGTTTYGRNTKGELKIVDDVTKHNVIKYILYCNAILSVRKVYSKLIRSIIGEKLYRDCIGTLTDKEGTGQEVWTIFNTNRIPVNAVNFRTGENVLKFHVQSIDMMAAVFYAIIKRTFRRAKGNVQEEKILWAGYPDVMVDELNNLLSDYFYEACNELEPSVFIEEDYREDPQILLNAEALLLRYLTRNGSERLKNTIKEIPELQDALEFSASEEDIDSITKSLLASYKLLDFS
jgi:hypothetical protein